MTSKTPIADELRVELEKARLNEMDVQYAFAAMLRAVIDHGSLRDPPPHWLDRNINALVVDDDDDAAPILERRLRGSIFKWSITRVASAEEATKAIEASESPFDIILLDRDLRDGNGFSLARWVKRHEHVWVQSIPVVAFTGATPAETLEEPLSPYVGGVIFKGDEVARIDATAGLAIRHADIERLWLETLATLRDVADILPGGS